MIGIDDIRDAAARLEGVAHRTPVVTSRTLDRLTGATVYVKVESFQRVGAFKFRGAYNMVSRLDRPSLALGVLAYSSGNHAQAVALASRLMDAPATIVMPADAPPAKLAGTRGYGAEVVTYDRATEDRETIGNGIAAERGLTVIPPYDHPLIMAGQGTVATELIDEVGDLDVVLVPVGGGGLIAGCATAAKAMVPGVEVYGVEPAGADDTRQSLEAGRRVRIPPPRTIADGQLAQTPGRLTFQVNRRLLNGVAVVTDEQTLQAMTFAFDRLKLVTEPSGATALAAAMAGGVDITGLRVGVVISGGNVGLHRFIELLSGHGAVVTPERGSRRS
ncbi:MAG: pyridoxal-phosphate dependent enzyme [Nitriliruptorales bacterium]|nr:pyridoxal-phosphate dependent enzyme [Nitriliruptorales bacterium]